MAILEIKELRKSFGGLAAVAGVDLKVREGHIDSIIGPNGAGKSTLFNLISGYYSCDGGQVFFKGKDITGLTPQKRVKMGMGRSFQVTNIFPKLTVFENIQATIIYRIGKGINFFSDVRKYVAEETEEILSMVELIEQANDMAGILSAGDRKRLEMGIVLATAPDLLLLDEPTCGMSPVETSNTIELIKKIAQDKSLTVLFTEHKMDMVFSISSRITVMNFGAIIAAGKPDDIRANEKVQQIYFGENRCSSK
jgi:branched-chain amino acid transport system ATP-binding protein